MANRFRYESSQTGIKHCNSLLVDKISKIKTDVKVTNLQRSYIMDTTAVDKTVILETGPVHSLHQNYKKKEQFRIANENSTMIDRLEKTYSISITL